MNIFYKNKKKEEKTSLPSHFSGLFKVGKSYCVCVGICMCLCKCKGSELGGGGLWARNYVLIPYIYSSSHLAEAQNF